MIRVAVELTPQAEAEQIAALSAWIEYETSILRAVIAAGSDSG
jgi:hypothetical protein